MCIRCIQFTISPSASQKGKLVTDLLNKANKLGGKITVPSDAQVMVLNVFRNAIKIQRKNPCLSARFE
jgi:isocitrate lyase